MSRQIGVGEQLDSQFLYEQQCKLRARGLFPPAPAVVAVGLQLVENVGSVLRLADAAGSRRVILVHDEQQDDYPLKRIHRTARNAEALVEWESWAQDQFLTRCKQLEPLIAVELTSNSASIFDIDLPLECTYIIGNERHGIPTGILETCEQAVYIPMYGVNGSMNVTHALAIALYEWRRRYPE